MWVLLIVMGHTHGVTSEQIRFQTEESCMEAAADLATQEGWLGYDSNFVVATRCVEVPK